MGTYENPRGVNFYIFPLYLSDNNLSVMEVNFQRVKYLRSKAGQEGVFIYPN